MEEIKEKFQKIQRSKDAQEIKDFLIDLSKNLSKDSVIIIEFIIDNFDLPLIEKIKLNLIYLIGEIGKNYSIEEKFYNYLLENFFTSDRWVREEILLSLIKISKNLIDTNELWKVLNFALNEEYKPIKLNALKLVNDNGLFVVAIYNKHWSSPIWRVIKKLYNFSPKVIQQLMICVFYWVIAVAKFLVTGKNPFTNKRRGMNYYYDVIDWIGGYPYEYASKNEIQSFVEGKGFKLQKFNKAPVPTGCNEYVFKKS